MACVPYKCTTDPVGKRFVFVLQLFSGASFTLRVVDHVRLFEPGLLSPRITGLPAAKLQAHDIKGVSISPGGIL